MRPRRPPPLPILVAAAQILVAATAPPALAEPPATALPPASPPLPSPADETRALRFTGGISLVGIGGAALVLSSVLGVRALLSKNDVGNHCGAGGVCDLTGYTYGTQAQDFATISTVFFTGGIVLASTGVAFLLSAKPWKPGLGPGGSRPSAWIAPTFRGATLGARW